MHKKITAYILCGPTAVGKSDAAVALAEALSRGMDFDGAPLPAGAPNAAEIISADSRQVYRGLDVGSGKITTEEMHGIPHHLLDVADPHETYTAGRFAQEAYAALKDIAARGKTPIIVGGSGFYIEALERKALGLPDLPDVPANPDLRAELAEQSTETLAALLKELDPRRHADIDIHNKVRLVRAIEIARARGSVPPRDEQVNGNTPAPTSSWHFIKIGLDADDATLRERIHARLIRRMPAIIDEVRALQSGPRPLPLSRLIELGLEYRYVGEYLAGAHNEAALEKMTAALELAIWHFAKRQRTWFKRDTEVRWVRR